MSEEAFLNLMRCLINGLYFLQKHKVSHGRLKRNNIYYFEENDVFKVGDPNYFENFMGTK
jgi:hypothetical protein